MKIQRLLIFLTAVNLVVAIYTLAQRPAAAESVAPVVQTSSIRRYEVDESQDWARKAPAIFFTRALPPSAV